MWGGMNPGCEGGSYGGGPNSGGGIGTPWGCPTTGVTPSERKHSQQPRETRGGGREVGDNPLSHILLWTTRNPNSAQSREQCQALGWVIALRSPPASPKGAKGAEGAGQSPGTHSWVLWQCPPVAVSPYLVPRGGRASPLSAAPRGPPGREGGDRWTLLRQPCRDRNLRVTAALGATGAGDGGDR